MKNTKSYNLVDTSVCTDDVIFAAFSNYSEHTAIIEKEHIITYRELENIVRAIQLEILRELPESGKCVAVCMQRNADLVACCLAVMLSGCTYVPIDHTYPLERKNFILQDCDCALILTDADEQFEKKGTPILLFSEIQKSVSGLLIKPLAKSDIAYIIYTSGSKGKPKGVAVGHTAILNTLYWLRDTFSVGTNDIIALKTSIGFTDSIVELLLPVICGAAMKVINDEELHNIEKLYSALETVTIAQFVPPLLGMLLAHIRVKAIEYPLQELKWIFNGGQAIYMDLVRKVAELLPQVKVANTYGMTESAVYSTCKILKPNDKEALIGRAISNMQAHLIDGEKVIDEPDIIGEICLCGIGLMTCYLNDSDLTEKKLAYHNRLGKRLYHTGDLGKWTQDGELAYCGRKDDQVNVNGMRVEINEIEMALATCSPGMQKAIVALNDENGETRILCFYSDSNVDIVKLRTNLLKFLPEYMIPAEFIHVSKMPLTVNGKIDKNELLLTLSPKKTREKVFSIIKNLWSTLLPFEMDVKGNFFELGGDSLLAMKLITMLDILGFRVNYDTFRNNPTIEHLLELICNDKSNFKDA